MLHSRVLRSRDCGKFIGLFQTQSHSSLFDALHCQPCPPGKDCIFPGALGLDMQVHG